MSNQSEGDTGYVTYLLNERVKELTTLYTVGKLLHEDKRTSDEVLQDVVNALPPGWQYPEITEARITIGHKTYTTPGFINEFPIQSSLIKLPDNQQGRIEVMYTREMPEFAEGPFLAEERKLIDMIAEMMCTYFEKKSAAELLSKSKANLQTIFDNTDTTYLLLDPSFKVIAFNQRAIEFVKKEFKTGVFKLNDCIIDYFPASKKEELTERMQQALSGEILNYESSYEQTDGSTHWYHVRLFPVLGELRKPFGLVTAITDITDKKHLEQKILNQKVQEQKAITRAILLAQEKERNKIGQELHDNVNQILVGAKMHLGLIKKKGDQTDEFLKKAESLLDNGINEIRLLTREQVTPTRSVDLKNMIGELVKNMEQHSAIKTDFIYDIEKMDMDDDVKLNIYRIIQECLNNIVKHAAAKYVSILLFTDRVGIHTVVSDDGKGFSLTSNARNGIGLNNILNRAESYNGKVSVESGPAKGCRVEVTIPL